MLFKYLGIMAESGVPLEKSLIAIHRQARSRALHRALHIMLADVSAGEFISTSLQKMPRFFGGLVTQLVAVGEESGTLTESFLRVSEYLEKARDLQNKIRAALLYPVIVLVGTLGVAVYMLFVLMPQLQPLFASLNVNLPWTTRAVLSVSAFLTEQGLFLFIGAVVLMVSSYFLLRVKKVHYVLDMFLLQIPVLGTLIKKAQITQFSRVIATLLKSGIVIVEAFKIAGAVVSNRVYQNALRKIASSIQEGGSVATYLEQEQKLFPSFVSQMVGVGEETGRLDESFLYLANFSEREVDDATKNLTTVLEPLLMVVIGLFVGFIAISIVTPIYSLSQGIPSV